MPESPAQLRMREARILAVVAEHAIFTYLATVGDDAGHVSLRGMLPDDKADLPREEFSPADWEAWTDLYFTVRGLLDDGLIDGVAADGGEYPNRFRITDAGRAALASGQAQTTNGA